MPGGDRTGPLGMGARTGRAAGYCAGNEVPGYQNPGPGRGFGMGFGRGRGFRGWGGGGGGRGWRHRYYATGVPGWMRSGGYPVPLPQIDPETEQQALQNQARALRSELDLVDKRIRELESASETD
jgi:hypothetical protein